MKIYDYLQDGAGRQERAVLHTFLGLNPSEDISVGRWENGREQGYVLSHNSLNIAFFTDRHSDIICAVKWDGFYMDTPTLHDLPENHRWCKSIHNPDHSEPYQNFKEMALWIKDQFERGGD